MDIITFRAYCLAKKVTSEGFPFDNKTLVFKVLGKMFALCDVDQFEGYNLKCDPEWAVELRETYQGVSAGYHMSKKHWNTIESFSDIKDELAKKMIDHSYNLVVKGLKKSDKEKLQNID